VSAYIKETGDFGILAEPVPFNNDPNDVAPLFEHLKRSFHHVLENLRPHGLPLIGRADWNDCLNLNCFSETPDESFQTTGNKTGRNAESVFSAGMFVGVAPDYAYLAAHFGQEAEAKLAREAEICYAMIACATDYDCWHESEESVTVEMVIGNLSANVANAPKISPDYLQHRLIPSGYQTWI